MKMMLSVSTKERPIQLMTKYKLKPDCKRLPYGGHHFKEGSHIIMGETAQDVISKITSYRLNNKIKLGDPERDLVTYYLEKFPWMVTLDLEPQEVKKEPEVYEQWAAYIRKTWDNPPQTHCAEKEAEIRRIPCKNCSFKKLVRFPKSPESGSLKKMAFLLKRGAGESKDFHFCTLHQVDIGVCSRFENQLRGRDKRKDSQAPGNCWVKKI